MDTGNLGSQPGVRQSAEEMDDARQLNIAYEYLCHLEEAKIWMEAVLKESLPPTTELEENLRNGVYLAKLGNFVSPDIVPLSRIYDIFQHRHKAFGLQFRHTDNINYWIKSLEAAGFPRTFHPETTDVYDKKNMPKVIYSIHALSTHLFRLGQAPLIQDLYGKVQFTKQEIDSVCHELKKYGVTMPAFQKIGGLLAGELDCDSASLHAAIISINEAIDEKNEEKLLQSLNTSTVNLEHVFAKNVKQYLSVFIAAKAEKCEAAQNKSLSESYEPDIYDELLTHGEIQGYIRSVNIDCIWQSILGCVKKQDKDKLQEILQSSTLEFKDYVSNNIEYYVDEFLGLDSSQIKYNKPREIILIAIKNGNRNAKDSGRITETINEVAKALMESDLEKLLHCLRTPCLRLSSLISDFAGPLYLEEMKADYLMAGKLTHEGIKSSVKVLNLFAVITMAVDSREWNSVWSALTSSQIPFMNVDEALKTKYFKSLRACREEKRTQNVENHLLTFLDIQECIDLTNQQDLQQTRALSHLEEINEAVRGSDSNSLWESLQGLVPGEVSEEDIPLCMHLLRNCLSEKQTKSGEGLWYEDVVSAVQEVQDYNRTATLIFEWMTDIQDSISHNKEEPLLRAIENLGIETPINTFYVINGLKEFQRRKSSKSNSSWVVHNFSPDLPVYFNLQTNSFQWSKPPDINGSSAFLSVEDVKFVVGKINRALSKKLNGFQKERNGVESQIVKLQAAVRGYLARRKVKKMLQSIVIIQSWWRGVRQRRSYCQAKAFLNSKPQIDSWEHYRRNVDKVIKVQALWRGYRARRALIFNSLTRNENPSFALLKRLASLHEIGSYDYSTDLKVQSMKSSVVETINRNQELACKLDEMDTKIGLLVQNKISVEALVAEGKHTQTVQGNVNEAKGIKGFSKEAKTLLGGYQQLFYLLQTDPVYLTRLIVRLPTNSSHVIQKCVLSLFNHGLSSSRDAYLLLRLFRSALVEEVQCKFQKPTDAVTGNPLVLKLAVSYARQAEGHNPLRNILGFLIEKVLNDNTCIDTNPVDIYRRWINQTEMESGKCSELPHSVTQEQALAHPEVVRRLSHNLKILKSWVRCFLERLSHCTNQFPYALRFIAKLLRDALMQNFPQTAEKDILKIVGNLVYYQYINSAIVAPDAFYIISLPPDQHLKPDQRRNLASIAKILQFSASKKGFGEESAHLMVLNSFIIECHEEMKRFYRNICAVEDLEDHFKVTKYSEAALIEKPRIYITLEEICECHKLLLEERQRVAPDSLDPIHEILDDLGGSPSLATLLGCTPDEATASRAGKMQVCLELDNKFQAPPEDPTTAEKLFIRTKEMITGRLDQLYGETLTSAINRPEHSDIATNLAELELFGMVKSSDDYQTIVQSLIEDVSRKQQYRNAQNKEIQVLRTAQLRLDQKRKFYEDQLSYYEQYLRTCLSNLTAPKKSNHSKKDKSVKYSGTRLREKGILIALDGVHPGQLKNVQFEISTTDLNGIYSVRGRFMGVEVEKIDIDIQDLLRLQFEGRAVMDLFGKAQINVNLLLHLLNKKFHGRS